MVGIRQNNDFLNFIKKIYYWYSFYIYLGVVIVRNYAFNRKKGIKWYDLNIIYWLGMVNIWVVFTIIMPIVYPDRNIPPVFEDPLVWLLFLKILFESFWYASFEKMENVVDYFDSFPNKFRKRLILWVGIIWFLVVIITCINSYYYLVSTSSAPSITSLN